MPYKNSYNKNIADYIDGKLKDRIKIDGEMGFKPLGTSFGDNIAFGTDMKLSGEGRRKYIKKPPVHQECSLKDDTILMKGSGTQSGLFKKNGIQINPDDQHEPDDVYTRPSNSTVRSQKQGLVRSQLQPVVGTGKGKKTNPWLNHVKKVREKHKFKTIKETIEHIKKPNSPDAYK